MTKITKVVLISLVTVLSSSIIASGVSDIYAYDDSITNDSNVQEVTDIQPRLSWINLGTITLDPIYINKAESIQATFYRTLINLVGVCSANPIAVVVANKIANQIATNHYYFYVRLTQYSSTDYNWRKYDFKIYADKNCKTLLGTGEHAPWQLRTKSQKKDLKDLVYKLENQNLSEQELKKVFQNTVLEENK